MALSKKEKMEFAGLFWTTQIYGQVSRYDLLRLSQLEKKLTDLQVDRIEYLVESRYDPERYLPSEKQILNALR